MWLHLKASKEPSLAKRSSLSKQARASLWQSAPGWRESRTVLRGHGAGLLLHPSRLAARLRPCLACRRVALEALALPPWAASPPQAS